MALPINDNTVIRRYTATAAQTVFAVPYEFFAVVDLKVYNDGVLLTYSASPADGTEYSVTGAGVEFGGNITLGTGGATAGDAITIVRDVLIERVSDFPLSGPFQIDALNTELARLTAIDQQHETKLEGRILKLDDFDETSSMAALPSLAERKNNVLVFDASGNPAIMATGDLEIVLQTQRREFVATAAQTDFAFSSTALPNYVTVFVNGLRLASTDFTLTDALVTLDTGSTLNDLVAIEGFVSGLPDSTSALTDLLASTAGAGEVGTTSGTVQAKFDALVSSAGANGVGFIQSGTGAVATTAQAKARETISAADYTLFADACAESVVQDVPLLINVDRSLAANLTTSASMIAGGGVITLGTYNLTINGMVTGGPQQIFNAVSSGVVVLSGAKTLTGHAEWWGCVADNSTGVIPAANTAAINAALVTLLEVQLMSADYYTNGTVIHRTPNHILRGASGIWDSTYGANGTRVVNMGADETILTMGDAAFSALNTLPLNLRMSDIEFMRAVAPTYNGDSSSVKFQYASNSIIERCRFSDSIKSLEIIGTVYCKIIDSHAKRTAAATGGTDSWRGFYCNGTVDIGSAGGNASLYLIRCNASDTRASVVDGRGFVVDGKFSDVFWSECETVTCSVGMDVVGNGATTNDYGNQDVMISHSINDSFVTYGIRVASLGYSASVEITSPYCGPAAGASSALYITGGPGGAVIVNGGQLTLGVASSCEGIRIPSGGGVQVLGTVINEGAAAAVIMDAASNCRIEPIIINKVVTGAEGVSLWNVCAANYIAPIILGKTTGRSYGIRVNGTADVRNEYNCTGIDSGAVNGGAGQKMVRNNVSITAAYTLTDTNTTSGVMT